MKAIPVLPDLALPPIEPQWSEQITAPTVNTLEAVLADKLSNLVPFHVSGAGLVVLAACIYFYRRFKQR